MVHMMKSFKQMMQTYRVMNYRVCATSAMREAQNSKQVVKTIEKETGLKIEIISGEEEADIIYGKRIEDFEKDLKTYACVDVGGGSTEVIIVNDNSIVYENSFKIGTLRMLNAENKESNDSVIGDMQQTLSMIAHDYDNIDIIGSGGNINKLYKLAANKNKKNSSFSIKSLTEIYSQLKPLRPEERMTTFSLRRERADVIVPAAEIFIAVASVLKSQRIYVPMLGLADGIIDNLYEEITTRYE
jgi:exopolyphosphatase/guanosine-5'-triphosphate,3'-diphosphate pyrophosphatase